MIGVKNTVRKCHCHKCGETDPVNFVADGWRNGVRALRAMCRACGTRSRLKAKRVKCKGMKNIVSTHGGSSRSPQKVVRETRP